MYGLRYCLNMAIFRRFSFILLLQIKSNLVDLLNAPTRQNLLSEIISENDDQSNISGKKSLKGRKKR